MLAFSEWGGKLVLVGTRSTMERFMGNKAKRRAWVHRVLQDPRLSDFHRHLALTMAEMDRRGFVMCELDGEVFFEPKPQYAASIA